MSILRQPCPSCGRTLELPAEAVGKTAKCPACEAVFPIQPSQAETAGDAPQRPEAAPRSNTPQPPAEGLHPLPGAPARGAPPPNAAANPFSGPQGGGQAVAPANPYQASSLGGSITRIGPFEVVDRSIEPIVSSTLSIFGRGWAPVILSGVIALIAVLVAIFVPLGIIILFSAVATEAGAPVGPGIFLAVGGSLLILPLLALLGAYLTVGMSRVMLAVSRDEPSPLAEMMPPMVLVARLLLGGLVLFLLFMLVMVVLGMISMWAQMMGGNDMAIAAISTLGTILGSISGFVIQFFIWPWFYVVSDGKSTALAALRHSFGIAMHNKITSFLLVLISSVLSIAGTLTCYIGQLVTFPLSMLMFAVGYLLITNQPVRDPKAPPPVSGAAAAPPVVSEPKY